MKIKAGIIISGFLLLAAFSVAATRSIETSEAPETATSPSPVKVAAKNTSEKFDGVKIEKSDAEWKKILTPDQYYILREKGTERPYTGALEKNHEHGIYY